MNRNLLVLVLIITLALLPSGTAEENPGWNIQLIESAGGTYTSIVLDSQDYPHISYVDGADRNLKYARWNGSKWMIDTVDSAGSVGTDSAIALDSQDYPHISYYDLTNKDLKHAKWNGSMWITETVDSAGSVGTDSAIALDSQDYPHISYFDFLNSNLKYVQWTGDAWNIQTVDAGTSDSSGGSDTSIALDSSDYPHISYFMGIRNNGALKYAKWTGSNWSMQIVDSAGYVGYDTSIVLDSRDYPHISYQDYDRGALKYAKWNGSEWIIVTVDSTGIVGSDTSIALDSQDYPHISYFDQSNSALKYANWNGSEWIIVTVDSEGYVGYDSSIALDSQDHLHISYSGGDEGNLKYVFSSEIPTSSTPIPEPGTEFPALILPVITLLFLLFFLRKVKAYKNFIEKLKGIILDPSGTFKASKEDTINDVLRYYVGIAMIFSVIFTSWLFLRLEITGNGHIGMFYDFIISITFIWIFYWTIIILIVAVITNFYITSGFEKIVPTIRVFIYSLTPISLFGWTSYYFLYIIYESGQLLNWKSILSIMAWIWFTILLTTGLKHLHGITRIKAIVAGILGMILLIFISFYIGYAFLRALPYM